MTTKKKKGEGWKPAQRKTYHAKLGPVAPTKVGLMVREPAPVVHAGGLVMMFERLAKNPNVDVEKLERLIGMQERIVRLTAKAEFDEAFAQMQGEIPVIDERGQILLKGQVVSHYALNEDIQAVVKPIMQKYGFALRFRHEWLEAKQVKTIGILSHRAGHSEEDQFVAAPDVSGYKNDIQSIGSARSYGQRYTTTALLNIATRGQDDDGRATGGAPAGQSDAESARASTEARDGYKITSGQAKRLHAIAYGAGRKNPEVKTWLRTYYGLASSKDITRRDYKEICAAVERPGVLPARVEREPGQEG